MSVTSTGGNVTVGAVSTIGGNGVAGNASGGNGGAVSLDAGGATPTITHANITTTGGNRSGGGTAGVGGNVTLADASLLSANTTITGSGGSAGLGTGGNVTFSGTVNGNAAGRTLTVNTNGTTTFSGAVGGTQALGSLTTNATGTVQIGGNVTTAGAQTYGDPVTLLGNAVLTGTTPTFGSTVTGGGFDLALNFSGTTTINGANFTGINNLTSGNGGTTNLTGAFSTTGTQIYNDAVALTGATTVTSSGNQAITFNNTVNGSQTLVVNTTGSTTFGGAVGGTTALTSLTTNAGGTTALNGGGITTTGAQTYNDAVTLGANMTLNAGAGAITFGNTLDGAFNLAANSTGTTTFSGAVGNTTPLTSLTTNAGGTTDINSGSVTTSGNQIYNDNVTMNQATTVTSTGGAITFGANATNNAAGAGITVDAPTINLTGGTTIATTGNGAISFFTDTLNPNGAIINAGTGTFALAPNVLTRTIEFGDVNTGRATDVYYGSNFGSVTAGSFTIGRPTHNGNIYVTGVAAALSAMTFVNGGVGSVTFENAPYVSGNQNLGVVSGSGGIDLGTNLTLGTGSVSLTALTGSILDGNGGANNLTASTANLSAANNIGTPGDPLDTTVNVLNASTTAGGIFISEADAVTLGTVSATGGNITINNSTGDMTITSVSAPAGTVDLSALGGSILSGGGAGPHLTAGGNSTLQSTLQAFNGVVGTQAAPINVLVNGERWGFGRRPAIGGISAFLTGTVLPCNALTLLNSRPGSSVSTDVQSPTRLFRVSRRVSWEARLAISIPRRSFLPTIRSPPGQSSSPTSRRCTCPAPSCSHHRCRSRPAAPRSNRWDQRLRPERAVSRDRPRRSILTARCGRLERQLNRRHLLLQQLGNRRQIERPGVTEFDPGMLRPQMIEDFRNFNLRVRTARRKHRRGHGNVRRALLDKVLHRFFQGRCTELVVGHGKEHLPQVGSQLSSHRLKSRLIGVRLRRPRPLADLGIQLEFFRRQEACLRHAAEPPTVSVS